MTKTVRLTAVKFSVMTAIAASFSGGAFAHTMPVQPRADAYVATYTTVAPPAFAEQDFNMSGTRGRLGLGANPAHPEGPGNVSN